MCEEVLSGLLTLGNAVSLLEFAHSFNAAQLKRSALQFICLNLPAVVENGSLASIASSGIMDHLTDYYRFVFRP